MKMTIGKQKFPLAILQLNRGETAYIERGSMVFHSPGIQLKARLNGNGKGLGKLVSAIGRKMTSGESALITEVIAKTNGSLSVAPNVPGEIALLDIGQEQFYINDSAFLAMSGDASYHMSLQKLSGMFGGNTSGLFIMKTKGQGQVLINAFGSIEAVDITNDDIIIDNQHVVAWSTSLDYHITLDNGLFNSGLTGEGIVNHFSGTGRIYVQTLNIESLAKTVEPYLIRK